MPFSPSPTSSASAACVRHAQHLSEAQLAAWYADADVFVSLSEHEGFCIPLLEAMRSDLPIVALAAGAVPETLGDAGMLLSPTRRPTDVSTAIDRVRRDPALSARLVGAGRRRLRAFDAAATRARFVELLSSVAAGRPVPV